MHKWLTKNRVELCDGMVFGHNVSKYGLVNGYLDYETLGKIVGDCVLNNNIVEYAGYENWEYVSGLDNEASEIFQYYIITDSGADFLMRYTNEIVMYHEELDMYIWGITHFGTGWDYVLTDMKLIKER